MTDRAEFVAEWARAIADTSYVSLSAAQLEVFAGGLTDTLVTLLDGPAYDAAAARRIGEAMITAHCTGADTLQRTVVLLGDRLPDLRPSTADRRVSRIIGDVAAGYAEALREVTLAEQDAMPGDTVSNPSTIASTSERYRIVIGVPVCAYSAMCGSACPGSPSWVACDSAR